MLLGPTLMLGASLAAASPEVPAPPGEPRLEWIAPAECPDAARGADELARFLGGRALPVPARVELGASAQGYAATVTVARASRTLHGSDCETLARAAVLVVAVSLDPVATAAVVSSPASAVVAATPAPPRPPTTARSPRRTTARADVRARVEPPLASTHWLGASGGVALALVPALTGAVRLGYAYGHRALRVQAEITYATPRAVTYPAEPKVGGRFQSVVAGVRACFAPATGRLAVPLCAGLEGGPIFGQGVGIANTRSPVGVWLGGLAGAAAVVRVHARVALVAGAELLVALRRPAFHVDPRGTLFIAAPVGLQALAGIELRLR